MRIQACLESYTRCADEKTKDQGHNAEALQRKKFELQASLDQAYKQAVSDIDDYVKREWSAEERSNRTEDIQKMKQFVGQETEALLNAIEKAKTVTDLGKLGEKFSENPQKWYEDALQQIIR